jgi:hypothetical protein
LIFLRHFIEILTGCNKCIEYAVITWRAQVRIWMRQCKINASLNGFRMLKGFVPGVKASFVSRPKAVWRRF